MLSPLSSGACQDPRHPPPTDLALDGVIPFIFTMIRNVVRSLAGTLILGGAKSTYFFMRMLLNLKQACHLCTCFDRTHVLRKNGCA
jgi:hypothetical protein